MIIYHDSGKHHLLREFFQASGADCIPLYRNYAMQAAVTKLKAPLPKAIAFTIPKPAPQDDKIIVFDTKVTPKYLYWLCKNYPDKRILLWYWNPVDHRSCYDLFPKRVEIWSYSPADCETYGFRYNSQFYFDSILPCTASEKAITNERPRVFFLGREKGRGRTVTKIRNYLEHRGIETDFHIVKDGKWRNLTAEPIMPYAGVIGRIRQCDAILDISLQENAGLSLRAMEALFLGKKLITNQKSIRQYDFYREENIYILGKETREIGEFLSAPAAEIDPDIRDHYLLSNWLKRFDQPEEKKR